MLLGIDNPHHVEGRRPVALLPIPVGSAGHRLWKLTGLSRPAYLRAFERRNFCDEPYIYERRVFVLGRAVWRSIPLPPARWLDTICAFRSSWTLVPHPSGRNLFYNDPRNRDRVKRALLEAIRNQL